MDFSDSDTQQIPEVEYTNDPIANTMEQIDASIINYNIPYGTPNFIYYLKVLNNRTKRGKNFSRQHLYSKTSVVDYVNNGEDNFKKCMIIVMSIININKDDIDELINIETVVPYEKYYEIFNKIKEPQEKFYISPNALENPDFIICGLDQPNDYSLSIRKDINRWITMSNTNKWNIQGTSALVDYSSNPFIVLTIGREYKFADFNIPIMSEDWKRSQATHNIYLRAQKYQ
jgi:hypothetical protein